MLSWSSHLYYFYFMTYSIGKIPSSEAKGQNSVNIFVALGTTGCKFLSQLELRYPYVVRSQSRSVLSQDPDRANWPSEDMTTSDTKWLWPWSLLWGCPKPLSSLVSFHWMSVLSENIYNIYIFFSKLQSNSFCSVRLKIKCFFISP